MGDFACLKDLPEAFRHCKATEDKDLNLLEFFTEHVSAIGQVLEGTEHETEEDGDKPHTPLQTINNGQPTVFVLSLITFSIEPLIQLDEVHPTIHSNTLVPSDYISKVFRPPIVA
jgi:hypothetical protein